MSRDLTISTATLLKPNEHSSSSQTSKARIQTLQIQHILRRLHQRDADLFKRLVLAVKYNDLAQSKMLAGEIFQIRTIALKLRTALMVIQSIPDLERMKTIGR